MRFQSLATILFDQKDEYFYVCDSCNKQIFEKEDGKIPDGWISCIIAHIDYGGYNRHYCRTCSLLK